MFFLINFTRSKFWTPELDKNRQSLINNASSSTKKLIKYLSLIDNNYFDYIKEWIFFIHHTENHYFVDFLLPRIKTVLIVKTQKTLNKEATKALEKKKLNVLIYDPDFILNSTPKKFLEIFLSDVFLAVDDHEVRSAIRKILANLDNLSFKNREVGVNQYKDKAIIRNMPFEVKCKRCNKVDYNIKPNKFCMKCVNEIFSQISR